MEYTISLPKLEYENHEKIRSDYKYTDDLINKYNWKSEISDFSDKITDYIDERDRFADVSSDLRKVGLPADEVGKSIDIFKTLSGDILNHSMFEKIGNTVVAQYEHYKKTERGIPINDSEPRTKYLDVEKMPTDISNYLIEMSSLAETISSKISSLGSEDTIEFILDLTTIKKINNFKLGFLDAKGSWIYLPETVQLSISKNKRKWVVLKKEKVTENFMQKVNKKGKYIRVQVIAKTKIPAGLDGEGTTPWTFIDELDIDFK